MKLIYISEGNLPSKAANSIQTMKMAQAIAEIVDNFELITIGDLYSILVKSKFDFQKWYGLHFQFKMTRLPLLFKAQYPFPKNYRNRLYPLLATLYAAFKSPDIIYTRSYSITKIALQLGLIVIWEWHNTVEKGLFKKPLFKKRNFLGVVTISQKLLEKYIENGLVPEKIIVEHDGVDLQSFLPHQTKEEARNKIGISIDVTIISYIGHLYDFKGLPMIYELAALMPHCLFMIVGGWEQDIERARYFCNRNNLSNVLIIGFVSQTELPTYLYASDILILPNSKYHNWADTTSPLKLFEYMASRRPIVASCLPNITTVLQDMKNALLAEPDCPLSFKAAIEKLLFTPQLGQKIADQAFQNVQHYTWQRRTERILNFIEKKIEQIKKNE